MAQRFGRNQRRRARAQVATVQQEAQNLRQALDMNNGLLRHVSEQNRALSEAMRVARFILAQSVALPPIENGPHPAPGQNSFIQPIFDHLDFAKFSRSAMAESTDVQIERMHVLLTSVQEQPPSHDIHCRVQLAGGEWGYAISDHALRHLSREMLERRLLPELTGQLARSIARHFTRNKPPAQIGAW